MAYYRHYADYKVIQGPPPDHVAYVGIFMNRQCLAWKPLEVVWSPAFEASLYDCHHGDLWQLLGINPNLYFLPDGCHLRDIIQCYRCAVKELLPVAIPVADAPKTSWEK